ncbi:MAG: tRNA dimethylallyltransferase [Acidimicrobiales bacterium]|nr:tRNA dimethylallyltransferase [Acidimicrobiales bacterium]
MPATFVPGGHRPPVALVGTTASGKSAIAMALARRHPGVELVSVDSMQVYRGMDIGTAKATPAERAEVRHHCLDLVDPWEVYDVHSFQQAVADALADIAGRDKQAILVGGTGLYLQAVIDGFEIPGRFPEVRAELDADPSTEAMHARLRALDPVAAARMEPTNRRRVVRALEVTVGSGRPFSSYGPGVDTYPDTPIRLLGIRLPSEVVAARIEARYHRQLADGFLDEVRRLRTGPPLSHTAAQALGYRELLAHLDATVGESGEPGEPGEPGAPGPASRSGEGPAALDAAIEQAIGRTRAFARRQRAWFRRDPRITWFDAETDPLAVLDPIDEVAGLD